LYKATGDQFYLQIAKKMVHQLEKYSRVKCGYAAIQDLKTKQHEDRLDSFVYAETFKYLYLMFVEDKDPDLKFDVDDFIFSTEAHLIPLDMNYYVDARTAAANLARMKNVGRKYAGDDVENVGGRMSWKDRTCPSLKYFFATDNIVESVQRVRESVNAMPKDKCGAQQSATSVPQSGEDLDAKFKALPLRAADFVSGRLDHIHILSKMGEFLFYFGFLLYIKRSAERMH
jgi:mannosidase alpha-like ER degradation enhancer 3